jgi:hypothetical protein
LLPYLTMSLRRTSTLVSKPQQGWSLSRRLGDEDDQPLRVALQIVEVLVESAKEEGRNRQRMAHRPSWRGR